MLPAFCEAAHRGHEADGRDRDPSVRQAEAEVIEQDVLRLEVTVKHAALVRVLEGLAQLERDLISERTKAGIEVAKARGTKFGPSHSILDNPKRFEEARQIVEEGLENITAEEALERLNAADPKAKKIRSLETWRRWVRAGCPGIDE